MQPNILLLSSNNKDNNWKKKEKDITKNAYILQLVYERGEEKKQNLS